MFLECILNSRRRIREITPCYAPNLPAPKEVLSFHKNAEAQQENLPRREAGRRLLPHRPVFRKGTASPGPGGRLLCYGIIEIENRLFYL